MIRFINQVATIEVNKEAKAVQVSFRAAGNRQHCLETMRIATGFSKLHHLPCYLLRTDALNNPDCTQLYRTLKDWLQHLEQDFQRKPAVKTKVAWLTIRDRFLHLSELICEADEIDARNYQRVAFDLFFARRKAYSFLQAGSAPSVRQVI